MRAADVQSVRPLSRTSATAGSEHEDRSSTGPAVPRVGWLRAVSVEVVTGGEDPTKGAQTWLFAPAVWLALTAHRTHAFDETSDHRKEEIQRCGAQN